MYQTTTWQRVERKLAKVFNRKTVPMRNRGGIVSFSFDDVPASACRTGLTILEQHRAQGKFYVCGSLTDTVAPEGEMHTHADLKRLLANGHEVGSHGFAHLNYQNLSLQTAQEDIDANRAFFAEHGLHGAGLTFAYPFGCANPRAKALITREFASGRIGTAVVSISRRWMWDCSRLCRSTKTRDRKAISDLLETTAAESGWLIFYTHEVCDKPGRFGCSPQLLEFAVSQSRRLGLTILPVKDAFIRASTLPVT